MLGASKIASVRQRMFIPVNNFTGLEIAAPTMTIGAIGAASTVRQIGIESDLGDEPLVSSDIASDATGVTGVQKPPIASAGPGAPELIEIGTLGLMGMLLDSASDAIRHLMLIPSEWNRKHKVDVRIIWSSEAAAVGDRDVTWRFYYRPVAHGSSAMAVPTDFLGFDAQAPTGTAKALERSATAEELDLSAYDSSYQYLFIMLVLNAFDAAFTENKYLLGVEFEYTPRYGRWLQSFKGRSQVG